MYYGSTLGEGDSVSTPLRGILSAVFVLGLCSPDRLFSQAVYGSIVGTVLDASGAAVAGASPRDRAHRPCARRSRRLLGGARPDGRG